MLFTLAEKWWGNGGDLGVEFLQRGAGRTMQISRTMELGSERESELKLILM
jgi:hypothetical protein